MAHLLVTGQVGSGKSVFCQRLIDSVLRLSFAGTPLPYERIYSTIPLTGYPYPVQQVALTLEDSQKTGLPYVYDVTCGVLFIDELHKLVPARGWANLTREAQVFWTTHRHRDLVIVSNTQHVSFIDKIVRVITDSVYLVSMTSFPYLGLLFPSSVRPPHACTCPVARRFPHARRDAVGDTHTWYGRFFRFGTFFSWAKFPASILMSTESLDALELDSTSKRIDSGTFLFSLPLAQRAERSVTVVS